MEISYHVEETSPTYNQQRLTYEEFEQAFHKDEFHHIAEEWNKLRKEAVNLCMKSILLPTLQREMHEKMLQEAKDCVLKVSWFFLVSSGGLHQNHENLPKMFI